MRDGAFAPGAMDLKGKKGLVVGAAAAYPAPTPRIRSPAMSPMSMAR